MDCELQTHSLVLMMCMAHVADQRVADFRMLAKAMGDDTPLTPADTQHLMALFGTFPPEIESEP